MVIENLIRHLKMKGTNISNFLENVRSRHTGSSASSKNSNVSFLPSAIYLFRSLLWRAISSNLDNSAYKVQPYSNTNFLCSYIRNLQAMKTTAKMRLLISLSRRHLLAKRVWTSFIILFTVILLKSCRNSLHIHVFDRFAERVS